MPHIRTYERNIIYLCYVIGEPPLPLIDCNQWSSLVGLLFVEPLHFPKKVEKLECRQLLDFNTLSFVYACPK
jgi:hypothetical protein